MLHAQMYLTKHSECFQNQRRTCISKINLIWGYKLRYNQCIHAIHQSFFLNNTWEASLSFSAAVYIVGLSSRKTHEKLCVSMFEHVYVLFIDSDNVNLTYTFTATIYCLTRGTKHFMCFQKKSKQIGAC